MTMVTAKIQQQYHSNSDTFESVLKIRLFAVQEEEYLF